MRPAACTLAVALLLVVASTCGDADPLILVSLLTLAAIGYMGARTPHLIHLIFEHRGPRPDTNLWRWGATAMIVTAAGLTFFTHRLDLPALAGIELNLLYASAKLGCAKAGCCTASPRSWFVRLNLPVLEATASLTLAVGSIFLMFGLSQIELALIVAVAGYQGVRLSSYVARDQRLALRETDKIPDLIASTFVMLSIAMVVSYRVLLGV